LIPVGDDFGFSDSLWKWLKNMTSWMIHLTFQATLYPQR
jgi:hypothetical protein